jgi:hypothetical protein
VSQVEVRELVPLAHDAWDAALEASGQRYRFSHRAAAGQALAAAFSEYSFEPHRVAYNDGVSVLVPLVRGARRLPVLTTMFAMPLGLEGTPLVLEGEIGPAHVRALFHALGCGRLLVHGGAGGTPPGGAAAGEATHVLDLTPGFDAVWSGSFSSKNRNSCRKAEKAGVDIETSTAVGEYHHLYAAASRAWGYDEPPYPRALLDGLAASGHAELWLARLDGAAIAGALLLRGSHDVLYWSGAVDATHRTLAPGNAVIKAAIESACQRGVAYFDFGASTGLPGVSAFKESFGATEVRYASADLRSTRYRAAALGQRALATIRPSA